jgi:hypothetical protein
VREHDQADARPPEDDQADKFLRLVTFPEEDRHLYTNTLWSGGFRWFRSPNVIPIERWRLLKAKRPAADTLESLPD